MIEKEFIPYEQALALKELGFNEYCFGSWETKYIKTPTYTHSISEFYRNSNHPVGKTTAPTFSQAFRWFREKYKLHYSIDYECSQHDHKWGYNWTIYNYNLVIKTDDEYITSAPDAPSGEWVYDSHEEAELACLNKLIELTFKSE